MTQQESHQKMIDDILENFDFLKCSLVMKHLDWKWFHSRGYDYVSVEDLKDTAIYLMNGCIEGCLKEKIINPYEPYFHSTGGLTATTYKNRLGKIQNLKLEFNLVEWDSDTTTGYDIYKSENKVKKSK